MKKEKLVQKSFVLVIIIAIIIILLVTFLSTNNKSKWEEYFIFDKFENEFGMKITLTEEKEFTQDGEINWGIVTIDTTNSFISEQNLTQRTEFLYDFLPIAFIELSEKIGAENYRVTYLIEDEVFTTPIRYNFMTPKWNIEASKKNEERLVGDFLKNVESQISQY